MNRQRLDLYWRLMRFHRPIGIWLLLWPTLWGLWLAADGVPPYGVLTVFVLGTVLMRAAGCIVNDFADREFDPHVARTQDRPIASGQVSSREALTLFVVVALIAFALVCTLRQLDVVLLSVPAVITAAAYPFMKRWISIPQAVLGLAFSWGIPMGYAALRESLPVAEIAALMIANVCWVIAYDTYYAMADRADDLKIGVKSSAILFGRWDRLIVGALQAVALGLLLWIGLQRGFGLAFNAAVAVAAVLALYEQYTTRTRDPQKCFEAFLHNNWIGLAVFVGLAVELL